MAYARRNLVGLPVEFMNVALSASSEPVHFREREDWGSSRTWGETGGVVVPSVHPRDLPAADVVKCDAEGIGHELARHYPHWDGVRVCCYESHHAEERDTFEEVLSAHGLVRVRGCAERPENDTQVWVRR
jgi:hypothetical protein